MSELPRFRAWLIHEKKMVPVLGLGTITGNNEGYIVETGEPLVFVEGTLQVTNPLGTAALEYDVNDVVLMQGTGVKDKHGTEIFEFDLVQLDGELGIVFWNKDHVELEVGRWAQEAGYYPAKPFYQDWEGPVFSWKDLEVVGNIYENPELAKKAGVD